MIQICDSDGIDSTYCCRSRAYYSTLFSDDEIEFEHYIPVEQHEINNHLHEHEEENLLSSIEAAKDESLKSKDAIQAVHGILDKHKRIEAFETYMKSKKPKEPERISLKKKNTPRENSIHRDVDSKKEKMREKVKIFGKFKDAHDRDTETPSSIFLAKIRRTEEIQERWRDLQAQKDNKNKWLFKHLSRRRHAKVMDLETVKGK